MDCTLLPDIGFGGNNMIRIVEFADGVQWVARLRIPCSSEPKSYPSGHKDAIVGELTTMTLMQRKTRIPIPKVYVVDADSNCRVGAPFMLMVCLKGNVGMDLGMRVPVEHKQAFFAKLADIHVGSYPHSKSYPRNTVNWMSSFSLGSTFRDSAAKDR